MQALIEALPVLLKVIPGLAEFIYNLISPSKDDSVRDEVMTILNDHFAAGIEGLDDNIGKK